MSRVVHLASVSNWQIGAVCQVITNIGTIRSVADTTFCQRLGVWR